LLNRHFRVAHGVAGPSARIGKLDRLVLHRKLQEIGKPGQASGLS